MITAIVLAAGMSTRMGKNKLLLPLNGQTVIEEVLNNVIHSSVDETFVVLGRDAAQIKEIIEKYAVEILINLDYEEGQSTSMKCGLSRIKRPAEAVMFFMGDQPLINVKSVDAMITSFQTHKETIVVPVNKGRKGSPVIFDVKWIDVLNIIRGDQGGRQLIEKYPEQVYYHEIDEESFFWDVDDEQSYNQVKTKLEGEHE